jgi:hypothetical protein
MIRLCVGGVWEVASEDEELVAQEVRHGRMEDIRYCDYSGASYFALAGEVV